MERLTYTVPEVAHALGISRSKAYSLVAEGAIATVPLPGRRRLIARSTLDALINPCSTATPDTIAPTTELAADSRPDTPSALESSTQPQPLPNHTVAPGVRGTDAARTRR